MENTVTIVGNVTADPELRFTQNGMASLTFGLAVNRRKQNRQTQTWEEVTSFFDVICWRDLAENAKETLTKGTRVMVNGRLEQRTWEGPDGERRSRIEVIADEVGPSLRWATATVTRKERSAASTTTPARPAGGQALVGATAGSGRGNGRAGKPAGPSGGYDEEPF